ncbi:Lrp/AsnC ligand binding domain-containing protein, partial [Pseudomonas viridiflava]|uniref:Lrp/AsnC ligand binding domain-containing protein n=1 Tax=Pseudomonas viridiflava TaxID=33069 RepID=UPI00197E1F05
DSTQRIWAQAEYLRAMALRPECESALSQQLLDFEQRFLHATGSNFTEFTDSIRGFPEVLECYVLMGSVDFLLRIVTPDIEAYER